ncbi:hypothetical protein ACF0H5_013750 [Mactra antiquata]
MLDYERGQLQKSLQGVEKQPKLILPREGSDLRNIKVPFLNPIFNIVCFENYSGYLDSLSPLDPLREYFGISNVLVTTMNYIHEPTFASVLETMPDRQSDRQSDHIGLSCNKFKRQPK